jgi:hypothetical protein
MIDVKQATKLATDQLAYLLDENAISDVRLEEVEIVREGEWIDDDTPNEVKPKDADLWDSSYWLITVSFLPKGSHPLTADTERQYKVFKIKADTGDLVAMKMREVA